MAATPAVPFDVLLGPDYAGKSSVLTELAAAEPSWRYISVDDAFLQPRHSLISRLRRQLVGEALPWLGTAYSPDFIAGLLQTAVLHLRDQIAASDGAPVLVDSYYYKILAKCRLAGAAENPMFGWWRSFPQPRRVLFLDVTPETAWQRCERGALANPLEYHGDRPSWAGFRAYQSELREAMLAEVGRLPVVRLSEQDGVARTARDVREVLADELV